MRKNIQPHLSSTIIQNKDGSFFVKNWLFFKPVLFLEKDLYTSSLLKKAKKKIKRT